MRTGQPDMVCFDHYTFQNNADLFPVREIYTSLAKYRALALGGHDGTGNTPIPFGMYVQAYIRGPDDRIQSQSEINMNHFAAWAFGYKLTNAFVYDRAQMDPHISTILFEDNADRSTDYSRPKAKYYEFAEVNRGRPKARTHVGASLEHGRPHAAGRGSGPAFRSESLEPYSRS